MYREGIFLFSNELSLHLNQLYLRLTVSENLCDSPTIYKFQRCLKTQCWLFGFFLHRSAQLILLFNEKCTNIYIISNCNRLFMNSFRMMNIKGIIIDVLFTSASKGDIISF
jgi:hypothetical protein